MGVVPGEVANDGGLAAVGAAAASAPRDLRVTRDVVVPGLRRWRSSQQARVDSLLAEHLTQRQRTAEVSRRA